MKQLSIAMHTVFSYFINHYHKKEIPMRVIWDNSDKSINITFNKDDITHPDDYIKLYKKGIKYMDFIAIFSTEKIYITKEV